MFSASFSAFVSRFVIYWIYFYFSMLGGTSAWPEFYMTGFFIRLICELNKWDWAKKKRIRKEQHEQIKLKVLIFTSPCTTVVQAVQSFPYRLPWFIKSQTVPGCCTPFWVSCKFTNCGVRQKMDARGPRREWGAWGDCTATRFSPSQQSPHQGSCAWPPAIKNKLPFTSFWPRSWAACTSESHTQGSSRAFPSTSVCPKS